MQEFYGDEPRVLGKKRKKVRSAARSEGRVGRGAGGRAAAAAIIASVVVLLIVSFAPRGEKVVKTARRDWYMVTVTTTVDSSVASVKATEIRTRGGAGYILNDGEYRVAASVYRTEREARAVADKQPDRAEIATVSFSSVKFPSPENVDAIVAALSFPEEAAVKLLSLGERFEKSSATESETDYEISSLAAECEKRAARLRLGGENREAEEYAASLLSVCAAALAGTSEDESAVLSSRLRYAACKIIAECAEKSGVFAGLVTRG